MVYVFLAEGFEIIEALSPVDMLRRAKIDVKTVGIGSKRVKSSCGVEVTADITESEFVYDGVEAVVIPGGLPGVNNLDASPFVHEVLDKAYNDNVLICAICAGPSIIGKKSFLNGKKATCYPGYEDCLIGADANGEYVVIAGNIITARGAGVSVDFGLEIVSAISGREASEKVRKTIQCR